MRHLADDGEVFDTVEECERHEEVVKKRSTVRDEVAHYASMLDYANERARNRSVTVIMGWIDYDMKQRPWRYDPHKGLNDAGIAGFGSREE